MRKPILYPLNIMLDRYSAYTLSCSFWITHTGNREPMETLSGLPLIEPLPVTWSPDACAECLNVSTDLYKRLWNEILPVYIERADYPNPYPGEYVDQTMHYWDLLTRAEQMEINTAYMEGE